MKPLFAIKHKPSGFYLPEPLGRMGRGGSHTEPVDCSGNKENPRLFPTKLGASRALSAWLQGKFNAEREWESENEYGGGYYVSALPSVTPQPHRKKEEMEVVEFHLTSS